MTANVPECREGFWPDGRMQYRFFYVNGKLHDTDGPACETWNMDGDICSRSFFVNGELHRMDGPTSEEWDEEGRISIRTFHVNGKLHRTDGPAYEQWYWRERFFPPPAFYVNGEQLSEKDFRAWQERQQRQRELRALVFALEHKFRAEAPEREFLRHILPAHGQ